MFTKIVKKKILYYKKIKIKLISNKKFRPFN